MWGFPLTTVFGGVIILRMTASKVLFRMRETHTCGVDSVVYSSGSGSGSGISRMSLTPKPLNSATPYSTQ